MATTVWGNFSVTQTKYYVRTTYSISDVYTHLTEPILQVNKFLSVPKKKKSATPSTNNATTLTLPTIAVCVKPFHFEFNKALGLVEFIEMYRLQGAVHFMFYNHTLGQDVTKVAPIICLIMILPCAIIVSEKLSKNWQNTDILFWAKFRIFKEKYECLLKYLFEVLHI